MWLCVLLLADWVLLLLRVRVLLQSVCLRPLRLGQLLVWVLLQDRRRGIHTPLLIQAA